MTKETRRRKAWRLIYPENLEYLTGPFPWLVWANALTAPVIGWYAWWWVHAHMGGWALFLVSLAALGWVFVSALNVLGMIVTRSLFRSHPGYRLRKIKEAEEAADARAWMADPGTDERIRQAIKNLPD